MAEVTLILKANASDHIAKMKQAQTETQKVYDVAEKGSTRQKGLIEKEIQMQKQLGESRNKATNVDNLKTYNGLLDDSRKRLNELEQAGIKVEKTNDKTSTGFLALTKSIITSIAVWKTFKYIMESTETTALSFSSTMNGLKTGLDKLLKTIASGSWKEFFKMFRGGMWDAVAAGKAFTIEMDRIKNVHRQFALQEEDLNKTIEEQRRIFYEDDKVSLAEKLKAADNMLKAMEDKSKLEIKIAESTYKAIADITTGQNKMSEEDLKFIVTNFEQVEEIGTKYEILGDRIKKYEKYIGMYIDGGIITPERINALKELQKALGPDAARFSELIKGYGSLTDAEKELLGNAMLEVKKANNQYLVESKRVFRMKENMTDQSLAKETELIKKFFADWEKETEVDIKKRADLKNSETGMGKGIDEWFNQAMKEAGIDNDKRAALKKTLSGMGEDIDKFFADAMTQADIDNKKHTENDKILKDMKAESLKQMGAAVLDYIKIIDELAQKEVDRTQRERELLDTQVSEAQSALNTEVDLYKAGYASNVGAKKKELADLKVARDKALKDEELARKKQHTIEVASLVAQKAVDLAKVISSTAVANAKAVAASPLTLGQPWVAINTVAAALSIAAIVAAVIAASTAKYAKGGYTGDGRGFRDETGEEIAGTVHKREFVVRRGPASKFRDVLEAINRDDKRMIFNSFNRLRPELLAGTTNVFVENEGPNNRLDQLITENKKLNAKLSGESIQNFGNVQVIRKGNSMRTIR